jgi:hypothetical protein
MRIILQKSPQIHVGPTPGYWLYVGCHATPSPALAARPLPLRPLLVVRPPALPRPQRQAVEVPLGLSAACHRLEIRCSRNRM